MSPSEIAMQHLFDDQALDWVKEQSAEDENLSTRQYVSLSEVEHRPEAAAFPHVEDYPSAYGQHGVSFAQGQEQIMSASYWQSNALDAQHAGEENPAVIFNQDQLLDQEDNDYGVDEEEEDEEEMELPPGADGDQDNDGDYQVSEPDIFKDDEDNYFDDYKYPEADEEDDGEDDDKEDEDEEEDEKDKKVDFEIDSDEEPQSDIESLASGKGERVVGDEVEIVDGVGSNAQIEACRQATNSFSRAEENSLSRLNAMIHRHEIDSQATVGLSERQIKGHDRYFDTEDKDADKRYTPLEKGVDVDKFGRKIPANQIMEPYMFQNIKTLKSWKRPENYTMDDVIAWSKNLSDTDDWYYSAMKCYATGEVEYMQHEKVLRDGKWRKVVVGYNEDGELKGLCKRTSAPSKKQTSE